MTHPFVDRFIRYAKMDTQAREGAETYPSSPGQLKLSRLLLRELKALGLQDAEMDEHGIVMATVPATVSEGEPTVALFAHVDTSPETTGRDVQPVVHSNYDGADIVLPGDSSQIIRVADNPALAALKGSTIITSDGTTLLGADDKSGVTVIMETVAYLLAHPEISHGPVRVCFTCDEEIGHGVDHVNLEKLGAHVGYTLDGEGQGEIEGETFSADRATIIFSGINIHPSIGKDRMVNAVRMAGLFLDRLPRHWLSPETTEGREGFVHPYTIEGGVGETRMQVLLRDFDTPKLAEQAEFLRNQARLIEFEFPGSQVDVKIVQQYRNMADGLKKEPRAMEFAEEAIRRAGMKPRRKLLRGGTDGSRLTELGLPTPNLSTGEHTPHSKLEWTCVEEMVAAQRVLVELVQVWAGK